MYFTFDEVCTAGADVRT